MKKLIPILLCLLLAVPAWAEMAEAHELAGVITVGEVTGDFDAPALSDPEARYTDFFVEQTDGSEELVFAMIDAMNDEAEDMKDGGALVMTENLYLDDEGRPGMQVSIWLQQSPFGAMMIMKAESMGVGYTMYFSGKYSVFDDGETLEASADQSEEDMAYYTSSYHFPYGSLECLQGVRMDENGYLYLFVRSDETMSFEFVIGEQMRILQTRVYVRDNDGALHLNTFVDYGTDAALEIPQAALDAFGEVMEPAAEAAGEPEQTDENGDNP